MSKAPPIWITLRSLARQRLSGVLVRDSGGRTKAVLTLALPAVGEQVLNMTVGLADTYMVGHLGAASIAAVSISNQVVMLANVLFASVATGGTVLIARAVGAEDSQTAHRAVNQSIVLGALIGFCTTVLGVILARQAIAWMGAEEDALPLGATYLGIVSYSFLLTTWMFVGLACLRGAGDTMTTMRTMMLVNAINIVISAALVYGPLGLPKLGVMGSAIGTAIARSLGGLLVLSMLVRGRAGLQLSLRAMRPHPVTISRLLRVGVPTGVEQLLFRLGDLSYFRVVTSLGTAACAAHSVALNAESLSYMPGFGFAIAATTLVGQGLGARNPQRAESDGYLAFKIGGALMSAMGVIFFFFSRQIVGILTTDPEVVALGAGPLRLVGIAQPLLASAMIFSGALRGAGDTRFPMFSNGLSVFVVRFGLALLFVHVLELGLMGAWYALTVDMTMRGTLNFMHYRAGRWKKIQV